MNGKRIGKRTTSQHDAVSEIVGTLILFTIALSFFSVITLIVMNPWLHYSDETLPTVMLVGFIKNNEVVVEHRGGVSLDPVKTKITITINGTSTCFYANQLNYWNDENGDGAWSLGEQVVYPGGNLQSKEVTCLIVDINKNCIIFNSIVQLKNLSTNPAIHNEDPLNISETSATLKMYYNFGNASNCASGHLSFCFGLSGGPYNNSTVVQPLGISGWYSLILTGLQSGCAYECWAKMNYSDKLLSDGPLTFYTYQTTRGLWHLDEPVGSPIAYDAIHPTCDGTVNSATFTAVGVINGSLALKGGPDFVEVPYHPKLNLSHELCIESWLNVSKAEADFIGRVKEVSTTNLSNFSGNSFFNPHVIQVSGTLYAVAYHDNISAYVTTFRMTDDGVFQGVLGSKPVPITYFFEPYIIHIYNTVYAIGFGAIDSQSGAKNQLVTLNIYGDGTISPIVDSFDFPQYYGRSPTISNVGSTVYAIAFGGSDTQLLPTGYLVTISIDNQGYIGPAVIDEIKFPQAFFCSGASIVPVGVDTYAIAYNGEGNSSGNGYIATVTILTNGSIVQPFINISQCALTPGLTPMILPIGNEVYAVAYGTDRGNLLQPGLLKTIHVNHMGQILNASLDTLSLPNSFQIDIELVHDDLYLLTYTGGNLSNQERSFALTATISDSGNISDTALGIYEFPDHRSFGSSAILSNQEGHMILLYGSTNTSQNGFLSMVQIDFSGASQWIIRKGGSYSIKVNYDLLIGTMSIGNATYTVSGTLAFDTWTKVDLIYNGVDSLSLYINGVVPLGGSTGCSGAVVCTTDPLIFGGGLYGSIDEIKIVRSASVPP